MIDRLGGEVPEAMREDARLLISELVANAVEHASDGGAVEVRVELGDERLRVEVGDSGPGFKWIPRREDAGSDRGWGLHFTDRLASRWGIDESPTVVWFELDRP